MPKPITTFARASSISTALLLIGLAFCVFTGMWWPWVMLVIGAPLAIRQYLVGRYHDMLVTVVVFGGVFITSRFDISWHILLPVLFIVGAIYVLFREFIVSKHTYKDEEASHNVEIEVESEKEHHKK